jgi:hypothetical protein
MKSDIVIVYQNLGKRQTVNAATTIANIATRSTGPQDTPHGVGQQKLADASASRPDIPRQQADQRCRNGVMARKLASDPSGKSPAASVNQLRL